MIKAVLDTNVIVSGIINKDGIPGQLLKAFFNEEKFLLVISLDILDELAFVLRYSKIQRNYQVKEEEIQELLFQFFTYSEVTKEKFEVRVIKDDVTDNKIIACALEGGADYIVSGDSHLKHLGEYKGIKIISPRAFKEKLETNP